MKWKDISSYSKGDTDRSPNCWVAKAGKVSICIHRHIYHPADEWLLTCAPFFDKKVLASRDVNEAKTQAVGLVRAEIETASEAFGA